MKKLMVGLTFFAIFLSYAKANEMNFSDINKLIKNNTPKYMEDSIGDNRFFGEKSTYLGSILEDGNRCTVTGNFRTGHEHDTFVEIGMHSYKLRSAITIEVINVDPDSEKFPESRWFHRYDHDDIFTTKELGDGKKLISVTSPHVQYNMLQKVNSGVFETNFTVNSDYLIESYVVYKVDNNGREEVASCSL